jgi:hypothetical protein
MWYNQGIDAFKNQEKHQHGRDETEYPVKQIN